LGVELVAEPFCLGENLSGGIVGGVGDIPSFWGFWLFVLKAMLVWCFFFIRSAYSHLSEINLWFGSIMAQLSLILSLVWKSWPPPKVQVFSWMLSLDRIPTRVDLVRRRVLRDHAATMCVLCGEEPKSASHLFVTYGIASRVWYRIFMCLGWDLVLPKDVLDLFEGCCMFPRRVNFPRHSLQQQK